MTKRTFNGVVVQHKTGTAAQWTSVNPTLAKGELGVEIDTQRIKIGDGVTTWTSLAYITAPVGHVQQQYVIESGYLALDGSTYSRTTYAALWAWAQANNLTAASPSKYQFGTGDGSSTFTVPNHTGRVWQGAAAVGQAEAGLPNITGGPQYVAYAFHGWGQNWNGAIKINIDSATTTMTSGDATAGATLQFDASKSNSIYGNSTTVQNPAILLIPQIKY